MRLRVIIDGARDPRMNMAIDEALLASRRGSGVDTLRIYTWRPTGVSLGRGQDTRSSVNMEEVDRLGLVLVRRPTGGRTLIHVDGGEVTYSIILSSQNPVYRASIPESAAMIARGLVRALGIMGIKARVGGFRGSKEEELCYLREGASDVLVEGRKVSGSAQVRMGDALLQHGTLLLDFDPAIWTRVIKTRTSPRELGARVTGLRNLGYSVDLREVLEAMVEGFSRELGYGEVIYGGLTPVEASLAEELYKNKYSTRSWNIEGTHRLPGRV
ncbi:MAG: lipoate--protein ligase family protein [Desulfurococcales archaeon]|nr:lipoate--protein ligase family protein [Desulfurococcales archaeon]